MSCSCQGDHARSHHCADVPYDLTPKFLEQLLTKHKIDYVIHGDDPCILPGTALLLAVAGPAVFGNDSGSCETLATGRCCHALCHALPPVLLLTVTTLQPEWFRRTEGELLTGDRVPCLEND